MPERLNPLNDRGQLSIRQLKRLAAATEAASRTYPDSGLAPDAGVRLNRGPYGMVLADGSYRPYWAAFIGAGAPNAQGAVPLAFIEVKQVADGQWVFHTEGRIGTVQGAVVAASAVAVLQALDPTLVSTGTDPVTGLPVYTFAKTKNPCYEVNGAGVAMDGSAVALLWLPAAGAEYYLAAVTAPVPDASFTQRGVVNLSDQGLGRGLKVIQTLGISQGTSLTTNLATIGYSDDQTTINSGATLLVSAVRGASGGGTFSMFAATHLNENYAVFVNAPANTRAHVSTDSGDNFGVPGWLTAGNGIAVGPSQPINPPSMTGQDAATGTHTLPAGILGYWISAQTAFGDTGNQGSNPAVTFGLSMAQPYPAHGAQLTWTKVEGAIGYKIFRGNTGGPGPPGQGALVQTITDPNTLTWTDYGTATTGGNVAPYAGSNTVGDQSASKQLGWDILYNGSGSLLIRGGVVVLASSAAGPGSFTSGTFTGQVTGTSSQWSGDMTGTGTVKMDIDGGTT